MEQKIMMVYQPISTDTGLHFHDVLTSALTFELSLTYPVCARKLQWMC